MSKLLFLVFVSICLSFGSTSSGIVYICKSESSKKYHLTQNCRGLNACDHQIVKITLSEAKKGGKTLCGWED